MKKEKLKLNALKVQSFVTSMEKQQKQTVDGGMTPTIISLGTALSIISVLEVFPELQPGPSNWCHTEWGWWCNI